MAVVPPPPCHVPTSLALPWHPAAFSPGAAAPMPLTSLASRPPLHPQPGRPLPAPLPKLSLLSVFSATGTALLIFSLTSSRGSAVACHLGSILPCQLPCPSTQQPSFAPAQLPFTSAAGFHPTISAIHLIGSILCSWHHPGVAPSSHATCPPLHVNNPRSPPLQPISSH